MRLVASRIREIQKALGVPTTGREDELTQAAVKNFQLKNGLPGSGFIDENVNELVLSNDNDFTTDISERFQGLYEDYFLRPGEFVEGPTKKEYIFLHHTAGWNNPYRVVDMWNGDSRGRIGTQYVIGGVNPRTLDDSYDGVLLRCFEDENYAWHLGAVDRYMHKHSIGIELCGFGPLTKKGNKYYTYANTLVQPSQVCKLDFSFRGYTYWHKYSDAQLHKLRQLLIFLHGEHGIDLSTGLQQRIHTMHPKDAFEYFDEAKFGDVKGILSHTNVREDKFDVFPQPQLVDLILSL